jgi:UDP-N-acetylglucosamine 2-epimerase (non-hydrolysing)
MREIASGLRAVANRGDVEVLMPLHPNPKVREAVRHELGDRAVFACAGSPRKKGRIWLVEPQEYLSFVYLMRASSFIVSDSGGIQEEAPGLGKPVLVARDNTERPEAILAGTSRLVGTSAERISSEAKKLLDWPAEHARMARAHNPYGDGTASASILDALSCHAEGVA